jgi:LuxR family maltose regulon positive regulatory protein
MEKPKASIGGVANGILVYEHQGQQVAMAVGTPSWYAWLETATTFTFVGVEGTFTAHKARAGNRRGGWYWRAARFQHGRAFRCYLGVSSNLTLFCLQEAARRLTMLASDESRRKTVESGRQKKRISSSPDVLTPLSIVRMKCAVPRLPIAHVPRPRLVALLEKSATLPLTLVSAPAGSGKTTLLTEWARTTNRLVAWLSLEAADSDPERFLTYVLTALGTLDTRIGQEARKVFDAHSALNLERFLSELSNDLDALLTTDAVLVLDDYHVLESEAIHTSLLFLLEHLPQHLHLMIGTRVDPPLPLARLRTHGQVNEIRADTLRFAAIEMQFFLHQMEVDLGQEALLNLEERTEGWIAGVQLVALALRGRRDHEAFLRLFRGNHRSFLEYLGEEILAHVTPQVRTFLLRTSILERLTGSLCDAVTQESGGQAMLEELRKANLFVSALDETGGWYRYHPLFAEGLRYQLLQQEPERFRESCARASSWYEAHKMLLEACEYALAANDFSRAVPLMERQVSTLMGFAQSSLLQRWLSQLPPEIIDASLLLSVVSVWTRYAHEGMSEELRQANVQLQHRFQGCVAETERVKWAEARANFHFMLVVQALDENDAERALSLAQQTLQELPEDATYLRSLAMLCLCLAQGMAYRLSGDFAAAERALIEASARISATNYHFLNLVVMGALADLYETQGELRKSEQLYQHLLLLFGSRKEVLPDATGWISMTYANLLLEWNRLDEAEHALKQALSASRSTAHKEFTLEYRLIQHRLSLVRGNDEVALKLLHEIEEDLPLMQPSRLVTTAGRLARTRWLLSQGQAEEAARWLKTQGLRYDDAFSEDPSKDLPGIGDLIFAEYMILARVLIAQGRNFPREAYFAQALALLDHFRPASEQAGLTRRVIEILVLTSLVQQAQGEIQTALSTLARAVSLAEPGGFVRLFADEGEPMAHLLVRLPVRKPTIAAYLRTLLEAVSPANVSEHNGESRQNSPVPPPLLSEPLSPREEDVLALLVAGASNQDIAARLVIAPNTAKRHVKHILSKLAVTNRVQAVVRARELHLL